MSSKIIPRVKPHSWLWGSVKPYQKDTLGFLQRSIETYGDIFQFRTAHKRITVLNRPEYIQHVLQKNHRNYKRHFAYEVLKLLLGNGLICIDGEKWKEERRLMQPHFHKESIRSYFSIIDQFTKEAIKQWNTRSEVWLLSEMTELTLDIITNCFLGGSVTNGAAVVEKNLPFALQTIIDRIHSPLQSPLWFPTAKNKKFKKCIRNLERLVAEIITEKEKKPIGNDLITMYLLLERKGENITKQQIFDEVITILTAGHETTAIALYGLIKNVSENDTIQQKIIKEFEQVTKGKPLSIEHLGQLGYIDNVIKESLRLSSPAWTIGREVIEDDIIDGYLIKKGESVMTSPYLLHRNKDLWKDPNVFDPDRFTTELPHKFAYFPFGGGPKLCIGMGLAIMEMQIILYHILNSDFKMESLSEKKIEFEASITLRPKTDIRLVKSLAKPKKILEPFQ
ncbi:cytochrome P450 [Aquimarina gracilis]|uniref:Cytochrome P450 n=1 Tax=Aquimarina gracilis TaxID=874422 RepID=A0ABU5ZRN6_9FLAO|nr:cytochrome P450 [Aquimarina gracilis]MEB3344697.1 cytochrome P450 [Aquimarina gracilis]